MVITFTTILVYKDFKFLVMLECADGAVSELTNTITTTVQTTNFYFNGIM